MLENGKISVKQFTILVIIFTVGSSILVAPSGLAHGAKQDAWIAAALGVGLSVLFIFLYNMLGKRYPNQTLVEYSESILGRWLGKAVALLFLFYFYLLAAILLREIGDFMTTHIMVETPIQSIHIIFVAVVIMATRLGLETMVRSAEIFFPWVIFLFCFLVILLIPEIKQENMQPVLAEGWKPVIRATFPFLGLPFLELFIFLMFFPYVNEPNKTGKAFLKGLLIAGGALILFIAVTILVLGPFITSIHLYPSYTLAKKINIGDIVTRIEALMAGLWFITIFFKLTLCFYATALGLSQVLELRDYRFLTFPLGMMLVVFSIVTIPNVTYFHVFIAEIWTPYSITIGLLLPLLLWAADVAKQAFSGKAKGSR